MSMSRKGKLLFVSQKDWRATQDLNPKMAGGVNLTPSLVVFPKVFFLERE